MNNMDNHTVVKAQGQTEYIDRYNKNYTENHKQRDKAKGRSSQSSPLWRYLLRGRVGRLVGSSGRVGADKVTDINAAVLPYLVNQVFLPLEREPRSDGGRLVHL